MTKKEKEWHQSFIDVAKIFAQKSNCVSKQVGAVIVSDNRIVSTGYNGTPKGSVNCCDMHNPADFCRAEHHAFSTKYEIHAEINAIVHAAKSNVIDSEDISIYSTLEPCDTCLKSIVAFGIKNVYFDIRYDLNSGRDENFLLEHLDNYIYLGDVNTVRSLC